MTKISERPCYDGSKGHPVKRIITARITIGRMKIIPKIPGAWKHSIAQMTLPYLQVIVQTRPDQTRPDQTRPDKVRPGSESDVVT